MVSLPIQTAQSDYRILCRASPLTQKNSAPPSRRHYSIAVLPPYLDDCRGGTPWPPPSYERRTIGAATGVPPLQQRETFGMQPLEGRTVIVTRAASQAEELNTQKSTRLNSSHSSISYAVFCLKKKKNKKKIINTKQKKQTVTKTINN